MVQFQTEKTFAECYDVTDKCLGDGMSGVIKVVTCRATKKEYALKTLRNITRQQIENAEEEVNAFYLGLGHENIVQLKEVFREGPRHYIVMEKLGTDLLNYCTTNGPMNESDAARVVRDVASALKVFHKVDVAHRDVKLNNIFSSNDKLFPVKLGDFGLNSGLSRKPCCVNHGRELMSTRIGTIDYVAPEVAKIFQGQTVHYTKQCDIWSLGVVMYALLFGEMPFTPDSDCSTCKEAFDGLCPDCTTVISNYIINRCICGTKEWEYISIEAKDLLFKLLETNPEERLTATQVLEHAWVSAANTSLISSLIKNVKRLLNY